MNKSFLKKLNRLINQGENSSVEFKSQEVHPDSMAKEIVALANTQGGTILLGVDNSGRIAGLDDSKNWEEWVANIARNNVVPAILIDYNEVKKLLVKLLKDNGYEGKFGGLVDYEKWHEALRERITALHPGTESVSAIEPSSKSDDPVLEQILAELKEIKKNTSNR